MSAPRSGCIPIAIVGIAAELSAGANNTGNLDYASFCEFLFNKGESYEKIPVERFNIEHLRGNALGRVVPDTGSFLKNLSLFDYFEFGITGRDAHLMPVSTRKLIETTFLSLVDSGIDYRGKNVGCYMSGVAHDLYAVSGHDDAEARASLAYAPSTIANRVSYHLDLRGPTVPVDTACSSSLYATHLAVQALRNGECEAAVVGGSQINHRFAEWLTYSQVTGVLAPDGKCKPFDASANGFSRSEGVVSVVLKPLEAALRDGDKIYGSILGTGVNSSGQLAPIHAPVAEAQKDAMQRAFRQAERSPRDVDFIESHTTGTAQGDPTEVNWIGAEFSRADELVMGSLKGNLGHLEITSFLASLCKVSLIFKTGMIPPNVNLKTRNPKIKWNEYRIRVPTEPEPLKCRAPTGQSLIAMTSSGIGGANGHCVLESPPVRPAKENTFWRVDMSHIPAVLLAGGLSPRSTKDIGENIKGTYSDEIRHQLTRLYGRRARSMPWRSFAVAMDGKISQFAEPTLSHTSSVPLVFVFSGQGPQYFDMGRELFKTNAVFHSTILELDEVYERVMGKSLMRSTGVFSDTLQEDGLGEIWPIAITLPALTMVQIALFDTLVSLGIKPNAVIGHSAGETAVLYASGSGSKALAMELAIARGKAMSLLEEADGTMAAVNCSEEQGREIIASVISEAGFGSLEIGCYNTPGAITLSGKASHIDLAVQTAEAKGIFARRLRTRIPVHSAMMDICKEEYQKLVGDVFSRYPIEAPSVEIYSTESGEFFTKALNAQYFWDNTRGPVRFAEATKVLHGRHPDAVYIELGPHPVLSGYLSSMVGKDTPVLCPVRRPKKGQSAVELYGLVEFIGKLMVAGYHAIDFDRLSGCYTETELPQTPYPFARRDVPYVGVSREITRMRQHRNGPLNYPQLQVNVKTHPALAEHVIKDEPIMPAAGYLEMALEFGARRLYDVEFISIIALSFERPTPVDIKLEGYKWSVLSAAPTDIAKKWPLQYDRLHAKGYLSMDGLTESPAPLELEPILSRLTPVEMKNFYDGFANFAQYGPMYQRVKACYRGLDAQGREEVLVEVRGDEGDIPDLDEYHLHPAILDGALHVMVHPILTCCWDKTRYYLPAKVGAFTVHDALFEKPFPKTVFAHGTMSAWSPEAITYDFTIVRADGVALCTIESMEVARHGHIPEKVDKRFEVVDVPTEIKLPRVLTNGHGNGHAEPNGDVSDEEVTMNGEVPHDKEDVVVFEYTRGVEMEIQRRIMALDPTARLTIVFTASAGLDGHAVLGFSRSLGKEYPFWTVRSAVFPVSWTAKERSGSVHRLLQDDCEGEVYVQEDGTVHVPRIVPSEPPAASAVFQAALPWAYDGTQVKQISVPRVPRTHVLVNVTGVSQVSSRLWAFIGKPSGESRCVAGIANGQVSNIAVVHSGSIIDVHGSWVPPVFAQAVAVLSVGAARFAHPERLSGTSVFVTHADTDIGRALLDLYSALGLRVSSCPAAPTFADLQAVTALRPTFIVTGSEDPAEIQVFDDHIASGGKVFPWSDAKRGIPVVLSTDPWAIGDALKIASPYHLDSNVTYTEPLRTVRDAMPDEVSLHMDILSPLKAYVLLGGLGSLGLEIALWMYLQGARNIVLTSRAGRASITERGSALSKRILKYLDSLSDLSLQTVAADAVSLDDVRRVVQGLNKPLGGCMILSAALIDRTFTAQTAETFEAPFPPKVGAFQVLEQAIDVERLDFLVTVSSVSAMFGNAGQTNYASANTALAGLTKKYKNAFCMVCPAIVDSAIALKGDDDDVYRRRLRHLTDWGMTASELCTYLGDGIRKLSHGTVWQYVPNFDWPKVAANMGSSPVFQHLLPETSAASAEDTQGSSSIKDIICQLLEVAPDDVAPDVPLTAYGLDSLSATSLSSALAPIVAISQIQLLADVTLQQLEARAEEAAPVKASAGEAQVSQTQDPSHELFAMVEKFSADFPVVEPANDIASKSNDQVILITGTRGSLGAHMLARLLQVPHVTKIFALLRKSDSGRSTLDLQQEAVGTRGIDPVILNSDKLELFESDLTKPYLGLSEEIYERIRTNVSHVVHIGWNINLAVPLKTFETDVRGLRALIDLAATARNGKPARLVYASTAGIFRQLEYVSDMCSPIKESALPDPKISLGSGYSESKWVSERILDNAMQKIPGFTATTVRIHQLTGGLNGAWKPSEWFPAMVAASFALGCFPTGTDVSATVATLSRHILTSESQSISWLPADTAATAMLDMLDCKDPIVHLRHPKPISWNDMAMPMARLLDVTTVPFAEWLARLEHEWKTLGIRKISPYLDPAIRIINLYRTVCPPDHPARGITESNGAMPVLSIDKALSASPTLQSPDLPQLRQDDFAKWCTYWRYIGALPRN
ncbi:polyketide synthase [Heliocybe sulcata]|uniref:Polyketide synthase n=1 Tax=Heliocybe sulcata TaxID=5364 RepID=A0A5C3MVW0_9AGAM|nr:polyketide synthase [Heliocybe sulcata]